MTWLIVAQFANPTRVAANASVRRLTTAVPLGGFVRRVHFWATQAICVPVVLHLPFPPTMGPTLVSGIEVTWPLWMFWWLFTLENWWGLPSILWGSADLTSLTILTRHPLSRLERQGTTMIDWLTDNWLWLTLGGLFVWMHIRPGGCGTHHGHHDHRDGHQDAEEAVRSPTFVDDHGTRSGRQHRAGAPPGTSSRSGGARHPQRDETPTSASSRSERRRGHMTTKG